MLKRILTYLSLILLGVLLFLNGFVIIQSSVPNLSAKIYYMAGIKTGDICDCPVEVGDCVCKIKL
jgi:hypothetical protein